MVKRLRHRPFTAVTRVRFPLESLEFTDVAQFIKIDHVNRRQSGDYKSEALQGSLNMPMWLNLLRLTTSIAGRVVITNQRLCKVV